MFRAKRDTDITYLLATFFNSVRDVLAQADLAPTVVLSWVAQFEILTHVRDFWEPLIRILLSLVMVLVPLVVV